MQNPEINALRNSFDLETPPQDTATAWLDMLERRVSEWLQGKPDAFWQALYRLDVSEQKVRSVIAEGPDAPAKIAQLILNRLQEKARSRQQHRRDSPKSDDPLSW